MDCKTLSEIAVHYKCVVSNVLRWIECDNERVLRVHDARVTAARAWEEKAIDVTLAATNHFELAKANSLACHYRWRASKIAPKVYGDKVEQIVSGGDTPVSIAVEFVNG